MDIKTILATDLYTTLSLDNLDSSAKEQFLINLGEVVLEGAILRYLEEVEEDDRSVFSSWVQAHSTDDNLIPSLLKTYPIFKKFLQDEFETFKSDALRISGS